MTTADASGCRNLMLNARGVCLDQYAPLYCLRVMRVVTGRREGIAVVTGNLSFASRALIDTRQWDCCAGVVICSPDSSRFRDASIADALFVFVPCQTASPCPEPRRREAAPAGAKGQSRNRSRIMGHRAPSHMVGGMGPSRPLPRYGGQRHIDRAAMNAERCFHLLGLPPDEPAKVAALQIRSVETQGGNPILNWVETPALFPPLAHIGETDG